MKLRIVIPQIDFVQGGREKNLRMMKEVIKKEYKGDVPELFLFPELNIIGYLAKDLIFQFAEPIDGPTIKEIAAFLEDYENAYVGIGFPEIDSEVKGIIYNAYAIIGSDGVKGVWRKIHLPTFTVFEEDRYFASSRTFPRVIEIAGVRIGAAICYDAFYPEVVRIQALQGMDLLIVPSASPLQSRVLWEPILRARAIENTTYVVYVNNVGYKDALLFFGECRIIDPLGNVIIRSKLGEEDIISKVIDIDMAVSRILRPVLRDIDPRVPLYLGKAFKKFFEI